MADLPGHKWVPLGLMRGLEPDRAEGEDDLAPPTKQLLVRQATAAVAPGSIGAGAAAIVDPVNTAGAAGAFRSWTWNGRGTFFCSGWQRTGCGWQKIGCGHLELPAGIAIGDTVILLTPLLHPY